jgi:protein subunit release factor B
MMLLRPVGVMPLRRVAPAEEWVRRLAAVYLYWAERKGYDRDLYILAPNPSAPGKLSFQEMRGGNFAEIMKRFEQADYTDEIAIAFEGSNVFGFLKGERGLHRLEREGTDEMVQIQVFAIPDNTNLNDWLSDYREIKVDIDEGRRPAPPAEKLTIIRTYSFDRPGERFIRDTRTNVRIVQVKEVMEKGQIDEFILAYLDKEERNVGWEDRFPPTFPF